MAVEVNFNLPDRCDPAEICAWMEEALRLHRPLDVWNGKFEEAQIFVSLAGEEPERCESRNPNHPIHVRCVKEAGHDGSHLGSDESVWGEG